MNTVSQKSMSEFPSFEGVHAWTSNSIKKDDWFFKLPPKAIKEIIELAEYFDRNRIAIEALLPEDFEIPACRIVFKNIRKAVKEGPRFAVVDRLPLDDMSHDAAMRIYWILMSLIARPVAQKLDGSLIFSVEDTGKKPTPGSGVRPATTNIEQNFHNDNSFNGMPPEFVTLLCINPASDGGGISRVISLATVHNVLANHYPEMLKRLYQPFYFDRQKEHHPDDEPTISQPLFSYTGGLKVRLGTALVRAGYFVKGEPLDEAGEQALQALVKVIDDPNLWIELMMERGQIQIVNNQETGHARTGFNDLPGSPKRQLERLWLRDAGRRTYLG